MTKEWNGEIKGEVEKVPLGEGEKKDACA